MEPRQDTLDHASTVRGSFFIYVNKFTEKVDAYHSYYRKLKKFILIEVTEVYDRDFFGKGVQLSSFTPH